MEKTFVAEPSAEGWQLSTPSPLLYAAHKAALDIFHHAGISNVFQKNRQLNGFLWYLLQDLQREIPGNSFQIFTPDNPREKGCQISLAVRNGRQVFEFLSAGGVFADWREPDVIRVAPVGLYNQFGEVYNFVHLFKAALYKFAL
jgi:kynureninase